MRDADDTRAGAIFGVRVGAIAVERDTHLDYIGRRIAFDMAISITGMKPDFRKLFT